MWKGVGDRTELQHIDPHSYGHQCFFPVLMGCSTGGQGAQPLWFPLPYLISNSSDPQLSIGGLRAPSAGCWISLLHLVSNLSGLQTDWISCALRYIMVQRSPSSCGRHNFALIQPVHGQGYNILIIPRPDAPVIYTGAFPILTARPGRRSIYNTKHFNEIQRWQYLPLKDQNPK